MSNVSTFGAFTMAKLGIYASQKAMQVTGNNITNINTPGYTRQNLELKSLYVGGSDRYASKWDAKTGSGVLVTGVSQIRSPYLDIRYRTSNSTLGALQTKMDGLNGLSAIFDEVGDGEGDEGVMEAALQNLIDQMSTYSTNGAGMDTYDSILKGASKQVVNLFNTYGTKLETLFNSQVDALHQDVTDVNTILGEIQRLNNSIRKAEIHGSNALELKDERNVLIDNLSSYIRINVLYEEEDVGAGMKVDKLVIKLDSNDPHSENDGVCLVDGRYVTQLEAPALNIPEEEGVTSIPVTTVPNWDQFNFTLDELRDVNGNPRMKVEGMPIAYGYSLAEGQTLSPGDVVQVGDVQVTLNSDNLEEQLRQIADAYYEAHKDDDTGWDVSLNNTLDGLIFMSKEPGAMVPDENNPILDENGQPVLDEDGNPTYYLKLPDGMPALPEISTIVNGTAVNNKFQSRVVNKGLEPVPYPQGRVDLTDNDLYGALQASREMLTEKGCFATDADVAIDPDAATKCGIPYYIKMWDAMAIKFAKTMNEANSLEVKDANGNVTDLLKDENGNYVVSPENYYLTDKDGNFLDAEGNIIPGATAANPPFGTGVVRDQFQGGVLFSNSGDNNDPTGITAKNLSIAFNWDKGSVHVMQSRTDSPFVQSSQNSNLEHMHILLLNTQHSYKLSDTENLADYGGNDVEYFKGDYGDFLTKIASTLGTESKVTSDRLFDSNADVNELTTDRDSVSGVDLNDEAIAMMQYNKSYAAACRFMTQLDEMLDKLINGTAL